MSAWRDATPPRIGGRWAPSRNVLVAALLAVLIGGALAAIAIGVGSSRAHRHAPATSGASAATSHAAARMRASHSASSAATQTAGSHIAGSHPAASAPSRTASSQAAPGTSSVAAGEAHTYTASVGAGASGSSHTIAEVRDPEEAKSYPAPASVHHSAAKSPQAAGEAKVAAGAASDAEIRNELAKMKRIESAAHQPAKMATVPGGNSIVGNEGTIAIPSDVPEVVQRVIAGANAIANFPYVYGGGHASFVDHAYDCSGSVSYALAAGGLLEAPETSGQLESWGAPGPGRWITVYANAGHTYMYVNVGGAWMLYDTAGRSGVFASRWQPYPVDNTGYVARHWPGM